MPEQETSPWGNPAHTTFARRFIRLVAVEDYRVKVHVALQATVEHMLRQLAEADIPVAELEGHPASALGTGLRVVLAPDSPDAVRAAMAGYGYQPVDQDAGLYEWAGSYEDALARGNSLDAAATAEAEAEPDDVSASEPDSPSEAVDRDSAGWDDGLPGERELEPDSDATGRDVLFLQAYLVITRTGRYDPETIAAVNRYKALRGLPEDGCMDRYTWQQLIPQLRRHARYGDAGRNVRLLSAALIAAGHSDRSAPVTASFGIALSGQVRDYQTEHDLRRTGIVSTIDWSTLLGQPHRQLTT